MASGGISTLAVGVATAGGLLVYAGVRGVSPVEALRDIASGRPPGVSRTPGAALTSTTPAPSPPGPGQGASALVSAAMARRNEKYSQIRRWQPGYSDCSSFVGKSLKEIGITPPAGSTTVTYLGWSRLTKVTGPPQPGDLIYTPGHIIIAVDATTGIGQQNSRANVQVGPITSLVPSFPAPIILRLKGW